MNDINKLINIVNDVLDVFYKEESILLENNSSERNLVFHFSKHFIDYIKNTDYKDYSVDCEYNRFFKNNDMYNKKYLPSSVNNNEKHLTFPDFIFHQRNTEKNFLVIEFKKNNNSNRKAETKDFDKLKYFTSSANEFKYKLGLFIRFGKTRDKVIIIKFINGYEQK